MTDLPSRPSDDQNFTFATDPMFRESMSGVTDTIPLDPTQQAQAIEALELWDDVSGFTPHIANDDGNLASDSSTEGSFLGISTGWKNTLHEDWSRITMADITDPQTLGVNTPTGADNRYHEIYIDRNDDGAATLEVGSQSFKVLLHELGHTILGVPLNPALFSNGVTLDDDKNDAHIVTVDGKDVTYNQSIMGVSEHNGDWFPSTPMTLDIDYATALYGAATTTRTGDDTYGFNAHFSDGQYRSAFDFSVDKTPLVTIFDNGGNDTLDASGFRDNNGNVEAVHVDLGRGAESYLIKDDGTEGQTFAVIYKTTDIENAVGGGGSDVISGNALNNKLTGGGGNDSIDGGGGTNTAVYSGKHTDYQISTVNGVTTIADLRPGSPDGTDKLTYIQYLQFADGTERVPFQVSVDANAPIKMAGGDIAASHYHNPYTVDANAPLKLGHNNAIHEIVVAKYPSPLPPHGGDAILSDFIPNGSTSDGNHVLNGGPGNDHLIGGAGDDHLTGGAGDDTLTGGTGNDTFLYGNGWGHDTIADFTHGQDTLDVTGVSGLFGMNQLIITDTAQGAEIAFAGDTILLQGVHASDLAAADFDFAPTHGQTFDGTAYWGGDVTGTAGNDTLSFASANYSVYADLLRDENLSPDQGRAEAETSPKQTEHIHGIENLTGSIDYMNMLIGDQHDNILVGGNSNDWLDGGGGNNTLNGGAGVDTADFLNDMTGVTIDLTKGTALHGSNIDTLISIEDARGTNSDDTFVGDNKDNYFMGMEGNDKISGGGGNDWLEGYSGNDIIDGGAGNDKIFAGLGNDVLTGGSGADTFGFRGNAGGHHEITDFNAAEGDRIDFSENSHVKQMSDVAISADSKGNAVLTYQTDTGTSTITLDHIAPADVHQNIFAL